MQFLQMCANAGVKLVYLPPYSLDLNPEFFAELKSFIRHNWSYYTEIWIENSASFLDGALTRLGQNKTVLQVIFGM